MRTSSSSDASGKRPAWQAAGLALGGAALLLGVVLLYQVLDTRQTGRTRESLVPRTLGLSGLRYDPATRVITGRVRNYTDVPYDNVTVTFRLLDARRNVVGTLRDSSASVPPGQTWNFRITGAPPGVTRVQLVGYAATRRGGARTDVDILQDV